MAWTQADLDALKAVKAKGVLTVEYTDQRVTYRSLAEIDSVIADMEAELGTSNRPKMRKIAFARD